MTIPAMSANCLRRLLPLCLMLLLIASCGTKDEITGTYRAEVKDSPKQAETVVELKANGAGAWKVGDEEVPFSWYVKGAELRVNTKEGGVIVGTIEKDVINITLPGSQTMPFKKVQ